MTNDLTPALPGHYATADGQQRQPISATARTAVRVADAAIARALWRAQQPAATAYASHLYAMPGLPRWPNVSPPYVDPRRNA